MSEWSMNPENVVWTMNPERIEWDTKISSVVGTYEEQKQGAGAVIGDDR
jgi:hypothetical protein